MVYILRRSQSSHHKAGHSQTQLKWVKRCVIIDKTEWGNSSQRGNKGNSQKRYDVATYCGNTSPMTRSVRIMTQALPWHHPNTERKAPLPPTSRDANTPRRTPPPRRNANTSHRTPPPRHPQHGTQNGAAVGTVVVVDSG